MRIEALNKISDNCWEIPKRYKQGMRVPGRIYASEELVRGMDNAVLDQTANVAMLPGIQNYALCMPDGHSGYGFPIGGVAAIDPDEGVISPGGIGFDINCGIRLIATSLTRAEVEPHVANIVDSLFRRIPAGVGAKGMLALGDRTFDAAMISGARWALENGYAEPGDLAVIEEGGVMAGADPAAVSAKARERGRIQVGTLGSGNHFLELQCVRREHVFDVAAARRFGIDRDDQVFFMIHCGSRGFGHQIATDYLARFLAAMGPKYGIALPDRELACAPFRSPEGRDYFAAMCCAINIAFLNRQVIMHCLREVLADVFRRSPADLGVRLVYDLCHNTAKLERYEIDGREKTLLVHRKGATRALCAGMPGVPDAYRDVGQPVLIGGSMESGSYLLVGEPSARETFFTTAHGSGRVMSRGQAKRSFNGRELQAQMKRKGIYVQTASFPGLAEEAGGAYKDIDAVVAATHAAGLSRPVAKLTPMGNIKG
ncbi:MAG TPA: RtcB family protein [Spirochaetota bacterium]|nr:RtcB family protein [Spirochaetota bacterium]HOS40875.1 RtcB family protein [Spirochaetota bacterium]HPU88815.1 RtcB family protein [Spirochaetota bacterium]